MMMSWTPERLPDLSGKTFVITGGNSGLGLEATKTLCGTGAEVVFTSRRAERALTAIESVRSAVTDAAVDFVVLDLSVSSSVEAAAAAILERCERIDALINNAGIMQPPLSRTEEGWELQIATNHLGHFRLASLLFPRIEASGGRVVPVSSIAHKLGTIDFDDLQSERSYNSTVRYSQSKLANLLFGFELHRRLLARDSAASSISCHPGYAATNLQSTGLGMEGGSSFFRFMYKITNAVMAQTATEGAYPLVLAAADPAAKPGGYYGPTGFQQLRGPVGESFVASRAKDESVASRLWDVSESLVGSFFEPA